MTKNPSFCMGNVGDSSRQSARRKFILIFKFPERKSGVWTARPKCPCAMSSSRRSQHCPVLREASHVSSRHDQFVIPPPRAPWLRGLRKLPVPHTGAHARSLHDHPDLRPVGNANHLHVIGVPGGLSAVGTGGRLHNDAPITGTNAPADPLFVDGHGVYSAYFEGGMGFRNQATTGVATGDEPETIYMVTSGTHFNGACCSSFDCAPSPLYLRYGQLLCRGATAPTLR